jgi:hypothetical protein
VDDGDLVAEMSDANNSFERTVNLLAGVAPRVDMPLGVASTGPQNVAEKRDLVIQAIAVKGKRPNTLSDCDPGENDVVVTVTNQGTGTSAAFAVRLLVDDESVSAMEQSVPTLAAGASADIRFNDLQLKKGEHLLEASADDRNAVAESQEDNNRSTVAVQCKSESD